MAKYFLENIHVAYPDARCGIVVAGRGQMVRDLLAAYPWIEILETNRRSPLSLWRLWRAFRGADIVVTGYVKPGGSFGLGSKCFARILARRGGLIGFADKWPGNALLYDQILPYSMDRAPRLFEQDALAAAGIPIAIESMTLTVIEQPHLLARLGLSEKKYVVVHLFAGSGTRAMSQEKRQALINALARELPQVPLLFTGTSAERPLINDLDLPLTARVVAGDLSVQELAALIKCSAGMVSIGTGPSHMASHLGARLIVLVVCIGIPWCGKQQFGSAEATAIYSDTAVCAEGHRLKGEFPACIEGIDPTEVAKSAAKYFTDCRN